MRYGFVVLLSSPPGVDLVADPFKLQERLSPPVLMLLFVTNSQPVSLSFLNKA